MADDVLTEADAGGAGADAGGAGAGTGEAGAGSGDGTAAEAGHHRAGPIALAVGALGVVFGDIGTSPL